MLLIPECALVHMAYVACSSALVGASEYRSPQRSKLHCTRVFAACNRLWIAVPRKPAISRSECVKRNPQMHVRHEIALKRSLLPGLRARNIMHANVMQWAELSRAAVLAVNINEGNQQHCAIVYGQRRCWKSRRKRKQVSSFFSRLAAHFLFKVGHKIFIKVSHTTLKLYFKMIFLTKVSDLTWTPYCICYQ